jgi:hypothetical protein
MTVVRFRGRLQEVKKTTGFRFAPFLADSNIPCGYSKKTKPAVYTRFNPSAQTTPTVAIVAKRSGPFLWGNTSMLQRVLAFLLIIGLLAAALLPGIAQDKDKDDKKADVKDKADELKKAEEPRKKEEKPAAHAPVPSEWNIRSQWASEILPTVTLILILVLFALSMDVRSQIKKVEQKLMARQRE